LGKYHFDIETFEVVMTITLDDFETSLDFHLGVSIHSERSLQFLLFSSQY